MGKIVGKYFEYILNIFISTECQLKKLRKKHMSTSVPTSVHADEAKTLFSKLPERARAGEEIVLAKAGSPSRTALRNSFNFSAI